jgi:ATPase family associated with various cellular activities (AAA)
MELTPIDKSLVDSEWVLVHGRTGKGKTLLMTGLAHERIRDLVAQGEKVLLISNYSILNLPEGVRFFKTGSLRKLMTEMIEASKQGVAVIICLDEIDKSLGMKQAATSVSGWMTTLASDARHYNVKSFYFTTQGRKASDHRLRVNVSFIILPTTEVDQFGHPTAWMWNDPMTWDVDIHHINGAYEFASKIWLDDTLAQCKENYNTREVIPPDFNPTISDDELPSVVKMFTEWCISKDIDLLSLKRQDVRGYIIRWNKDPKVNLIPFSKAGEQVLFTELLRLGLIEPKEKDDLPPVAEEPVEPEVEKGIEPDVSLSETVATSTSIEALVPSKPLGQTGFCCGKMQTNLYLHVKTRKHLKSVSGGQTGNREKDEGQGQTA